MLSFHALYVMLTIEITAPRVPRAHRARRTVHSAERRHIHVFLMFDIINVNPFGHRTSIRTRILINEYLIHDKCCLMHN